MIDPESLLSKQELCEVLFLLALLENEFGGTPTLGVGDDGTYLVLPTCTCPRCVDFRVVYPAKPHKTILAAAKTYGDNKLCAMTTQEHKENGGHVH